MGQPTQQYQQMAIALLAIATAALGFAIWTQDFDLTLPETDNLTIALFYWVQVATPLVAIVLYFAMLLSVSRILARTENVVGLDLVREPIFWLYWLMITLAIMFFAEFSSGLVMAWDSGNPPLAERPLQ